MSGNRVKPVGLSAVPFCLRLHYFFFLPYIILPFFLISYIFIYSYFVSWVLFVFRFFHSFLRSRTPICCCYRHHMQGSGHLHFPPSLTIRGTRRLGWPYRCYERGDNSCYPTFRFMIIAKSWNAS